MKKMNLKHFGVMLDMSRNSVMTVPSLKNYMRLMKKMGYDTLLLYMEDTYEVTDEPQLGYMRGGYTQADLREIDDYAAELGMPLIPCIQTLGHMTAYKRWGAAPYDKDDILLVGDERTYELIDHMLSSLAKTLRTRLIHIGMDEAYGLGQGTYLEKNGYESKDSIIKKHLARVREIGQKYGFTMMVWSDMFFSSWAGGAYGNIPKTKIPKEYLDAMPKDIIPVYFWYYGDNVEQYSDMMYNHRQFTDDYWYAGGPWTYTGIMPHNDFTISSMTAAMTAARKNKVKNIIMTLWGNDGGECSRYAALPSLFYVAELMKGNTDEAKIKARFERMFKVSFDDFMLLDSLDHACGNGPSAYVVANPARYAVFQDAFNGYLDVTIERDAAHRFLPLAEKLAAVAKKTRTYAPIFRTAAKLASLLAIKYDLGVRTRDAYDRGDKAELLRLAKEDYPEAIRCTDALLRAFEAQWMWENRPEGFDVQQIRFSGVKARLDYCRRTLLAYLSGKLSTIRELDTRLLPVEDIKNASMFFEGEPNPGESPNVLFADYTMTTSITLAKQ